MTQEQAILIATAALHGGREGREGYGEDKQIEFDIEIARRIWEHVYKIYSKVEIK